MNIFDGGKADMQEDDRISVRALMDEYKKKLQKKPELTDSVILYHGSNVCVSEPDINYGREDVDFGKGFYLTADYDMASKWACRKSISIVNEYRISLEGLKVYRFNADKEWLDFVLANRDLEPFPEQYKEYDVLIGPTADDKLFNMIEMYEDSLISSSMAIKVINCMNYSFQYVVKTNDGINNLTYRKSVMLTNDEKQKFKNLYRQDRDEANKRTQQILREINRER